MGHRDAAAYQEVEQVSGITLLHDHTTGREAHRRQVVRQILKQLVREVGQDRDVAQTLRLDSRCDRAVEDEPVLLVPELPIQSLARQELGMRAVLNDTSSVEHKDLVGSRGAFEPMRDRNDRASGSKARKGGIEGGLRRGVERR